MLTSCLSLGQAHLEAGVELLRGALEPAGEDRRSQLSRPSGLESAKKRWQALSERSSLPAELSSVSDKMRDVDSAKPADRSQKSFHF